MQRHSEYGKDSLSAVSLYDWVSEEDFIWGFLLFESFIHISYHKKETIGLRNGDGNGTFLLTMHQSLKFTADVFHVFCFNGKEKNIFLQSNAFFSTAFTLLNLFKVWVPCHLIYSLGTFKLHLCTN